MEHHPGSDGVMHRRATNGKFLAQSRTPLGRRVANLLRMGVSPYFHYGKVKALRLNRVGIEMALFTISTLDLQRSNLSVFANEATADVDDSCCAATFSWSCLTTFCMSHTLFRFFSPSLTCTTPFCFDGANTKKTETLFLQLDELGENEGLITTPIP